MVYKIAHISDTHLSDVDKRLDIVLDLVSHAIDHGADHLAFTGDILDQAGTHHYVLDELLDQLDSLGYGGADRLSFVPGDHDVYPLKWDEDHAEIGSAWGQLAGITSSMAWNVPAGGFIGKHLGKLYGLKGSVRAASRKAQSDYVSLCERTEVTRRGGEIYSDEAFPFAKRPGNHVVVAGFDTTRNTVLPHLWAQGELLESEVDDVEETIREDHPSAKHVVVLMHHYPFDDFENEIVDLRFGVPSSDVVRYWLNWMGATVVLCGHIHEDRSRKAGKKTQVISTASHVEYEDGSELWGYTMVGLSGRGGITTKRYSWDFG